MDFFLMHSLSPKKWITSKGLYVSGLALALFVVALVWLGSGLCKWAAQREVVKHLDRSQKGASLFWLEKDSLQPLDIPLSQEKTEAVSLPQGPAPGKQNYKALLLAGFRLSNAGKVRLEVVSDDGVRLFVDGSLVIEDWSIHPPRRRTADLDLAAGDHALTAQYFQAKGRAVLRISLRDGQGRPLVLHPLAAEADAAWVWSLNRASHSLWEMLPWALGLVLLALISPLLVRGFKWTLGRTWNWLGPRLRAEEAEPAVYPYAPWKIGNRAAFLSFVILSLVFTYPLVLELGSAFPSDLWFERQPQSERWSDTFQFVWNCWWFKTALFSGQNPLFCPLIYHPFGANLAFHTNSLTFALASLPFQSFLGLVPAYNVVLLLTLAFTGYNAFFAARGIMGGRLSPWLAGFIFAFNPFHMGKGLAAAELFSILWVPLFVYALFRAGQNPKLRRGWVWVGVLIALNFYTSNYFLFYCLAFLFFYAAVGAWILGHPRWNRDLLAGLIIAGAVSLAAAAPLLAPMLWVKFVGPGTVHLDLMLLLPWEMLFTRPLMHPWFSHDLAWAAAPLRQYYWHYYLGLPLAALALAGLLNRARRRQVIFFLGGGVFFLWLALNPQNIFSKLCQSVPILRDFRGFDEFIGLTFLCAAFSAAAALEVFLRRLSGKTQIAGRIIMALMVAVLTFEFWCLPYPLYRVSIPSAFHQIAQDPRPVAVLELPMDTAADWVGPDRNMLYQTDHQKPRFAATISRKPLNLVEPYRRFKQFTLLQHGEDYDPQALNQELDKLKVGYVVVERAYYRDWRRLDRLAESRLHWQKLAQDQEYIFYRRPLLAAEEKVRPDR
ncbi:MAG: PA14 domain-containing protein [Desulfarculaceae bacterium]